MSRRTVFAASIVLWFSGLAQAAPVHPEIRMYTDPDAVLFDYDAATGDFRIYQPEASTRAITTFEMMSESAAFQVSQCDLFAFCGLIDVVGPPGRKIFKLDPAGFAELNIPGLLPSGLTLEFLANDLTVDGALADGVAIPEFVFPIPEPTSITLATIAMLVVMRRRQIVA